MIKIQLKKGDYLIRVMLSMGILMMFLQLPMVLAEEIPVMIIGFNFKSCRERTRLLLDVQPTIKHYKFFTLEQPRRLVVDLHDFRFGLKLTTFPVDDQFIHQIRFGIHDVGKVRMVVELKKTVQYLISVLRPTNAYSILVVDLIEPGRAPLHSTKKEESPSALTRKVKQQKTKKRRKVSSGVKISDAQAEYPIRQQAVAPGHVAKKANSEQQGYPELLSPPELSEGPSPLKEDDLLSPDKQRQTKKDAEEYVSIRNLINEEKYREALSRIMRLKEDEKSAEKREFVLYAIAECLYQLGLTTGDWMKSIDAYQIAYITFPNSKMAHKALFRMGKAYSQMNLIYEANSNLREFVERYPDCENIPDALHLMGTNYIRVSKFKEASTCFDQLVNKFPSHERLKESMFNLGYSFEAAGEIKKARVVYDRALVKFPEMADLPADIGYDIVQTYFKDNDVDGFKKLAFQAVNTFPDSPSKIDVLQKIAHFYVSKGKPDQAVQTLLNALYDVKDNEQKIILLFALADLFRRYPERDAPIRALMEGHYFSLRDIYTKHAKIFLEHTGSEETKYKAGELAMDVGDFRQAIRFFEKSLGNKRKGPFAEKLLNSLVIAISQFVEKSFREGRYDDVVELYLEKLKDDEKLPLKASTLFHIGESYRRLGLQEYAVPVLRKALDRSPNVSLKAEIVSALGEIYYVQKKWQEFIDVFMTATRGDLPKASLGSRPLEIMGEALFHVKNFDRAAQLLASTSSQLSPKSKFWLARAYHEMGNIKEAERLYRQDIQLIRQNHKNNYASLLDHCSRQLGDLFFHSGRFADAKAEYQCLIETSSTNPFGLWSLYRMILIALQDGDEKNAKELLKRLSMESNDSFWPSVASTMIKLDAIKERKRSAP